MLIPAAGKDKNLGGGKNRKKAFVRRMLSVYQIWIAGTVYEVNSGWSFKASYAINLL